MISTKCKYAVRAILHLASERNPDQRKNIRELASELKIPTPYLAKILQDLVPKNIIASAKGPGGGFYLTPQNRQKNLLDIVEAIDGLEYFKTCGLGLSECSDSHPCPIHHDFKKSRDHLLNVFTSKTVEDLAHEIEIKDLLLVR